MGSTGHDPQVVRDITLRVSGQRSLGTWKIILGRPNNYPGVREILGGSRERSLRVLGDTPSGIWEVIHVESEMKLGVAGK